MVTRKDVNLLVSIANLAAQKADTELATIIKSLPSDPELARDVLLGAIPSLIAKYEAMASAGAEEWYRSMRPSELVESFETILGETAELGSLEKLVRWAVTPLFNRDLGAQESTERLRVNLGQMVERTVKDGARSTVLANALKDPQATRFARVPAGAETCAFCHMLASRGWAYATEKSASMTGGGKRFHAGCDCQVVPAFGGTDPVIEGYDPDLLYQRYLFGEKELRARFPGKKPTDDEIAALVRRLLPGIYQEGYTPNPGDIPFAQRKLAPLSEKKLRHILHGDRKGGGHLHTATKKGKTRFPPWWNAEDVLEAIEDVQLHGKAYHPKETVYTYEGFSRGILLRVRIRDGEVGTAYPIRGDGVDKYFPEGNLPIPLLNFDSVDYPDVYGHRFG